MNFTKFGTLTGVSKTHSKLLAGGLCIIRVLLMRVLLLVPMPDKSAEKNLVRKKNLHLLSSMIYQAFHKYFSSQLPVANYNLETHLIRVQPDRRIFPIAKPLQVKSNLSVAEAHEPSPLVIGYETVRAMPNYLVDAEGIDHVGELISTFLENVTAIADRTLHLRKRNSAIVKLIRKRAVLEKLKNLAPEYLRNLKKNEETAMAKYKLSEEDLQRFIVKKSQL